MHFVHTRLIVGCFLVAAFLSANGVLAAPTTAPAALPAAPKPLRIFIYDDGGAPDRSSGFIENCLGKDKNDYSTRRITGADVRNGVLDGADVAVFPGGSGSAQAKSLEEPGRAKVREFVKKGGGYLGICGGSYLATSYYPWSLNLVNAAVVDRKHWARGRATLRLDFTELGRNVLGVPTESLMCLYHQGPLLAADSKPDLPAYESLATFGTEVADNGAPKGVMIGTNAMVRSICGKGHVLLISPHPEQVEGLDYIIRHAVDWVSRPELVTNPSMGDETTAKAMARATASTESTASSKLPG